MNLGSQFVFKAPQSCHSPGSFGLSGTTDSGGVRYLGVVQPQKRIVSLFIVHREQSGGEFVGGDDLEKTVHGGAGQNGLRELCVRSRVFVSGVNQSLSRQRAQNRVESRIHLRRRALEKPATSGVEQSVSGENGLLVGFQVPCVVADGVLSVARSVQRGDFYVLAQLPGGGMSGGSGDQRRLLPRNDRQRGISLVLLH